MEEKTLEPEEDNNGAYKEVGKKWQFFFIFFLFFIFFTVGVMGGVMVVMLAVTQSSLYAKTYWNARKRSRAGSWP